MEKENKRLKRLVNKLTRALKLIAKADALFAGGMIAKKTLEKVKKCKE